MNTGKETFTQFDAASTGCPYMLVPTVFKDSRGTFSEVLAGEEALGCIKQINRSTSCKYALRGFHAQRAPFCQSKLVEALSVPIVDIIIDARPDSSTLGLCEAFMLDPAKQNKLYVPRGFLHGFFVPSWDYSKSQARDAVFMYYCDNVYDHASEVGISPASVITMMSSACSAPAPSDAMLWLCCELEDTERIVMSEKDTNGIGYSAFIEEVVSMHKSTGKLWYA